VSSLLSHRTRNADSGRAFRELKARFGTREVVRDAPTGAVEAAIAAAARSAMLLPPAPGLRPLSGARSLSHRPARVPAEASCPLPVS
jgi:hypothetical protein